MELNSKRFKMIDEEFTCIVCGKNIKPLGYSARDHCPHCLCSLHVDKNPGDRLEKCHGVLEPIDIDKGKKEMFKIVYKCNKCGIIKRNVAATDDELDSIIKVMAKKDI